ncbi:hypothetical protein HDK64DRAFT_283353 [Phyllosticta capitalensis]
MVRPWPLAAARIRCWLLAVLDLANSPAAVCPARCDYPHTSAPLLCSGSPELGDLLSPFQRWSGLMDGLTIFCAALPAKQSDIVPSVSNSVIGAFVWSGRLC